MKLRTFWAYQPVLECSVIRADESNQNTPLGAFPCAELYLASLTSSCRMNYNICMPLNLDKLEIGYKMLNAIRDATVTLKSESVNFGYKLRPTTQKDVDEEYRIHDDGDPVYKIAEETFCDRKVSLFATTPFDAKTVEWVVGQASESDKRFIHLYNDSDEELGYARYERGAEEVFLHFIYTSPEFRSMGVAKDLIGCIGLFEPEASSISGKAAHKVSGKLFKMPNIVALEDFKPEDEDNMGAYELGNRLTDESSFSCPLDGFRSRIRAKIDSEIGFSM